MFKIGSKVQLKASAQEVYNNVWGGAIGYVRDVRVDEDGYEKVFIEWDREDDWRYSGGESGWTYASHFDLKEEPAKTPRPPRITKKDIAKHQELDAYMQELQKSVESLSGSEGFILFVAKREVVDQQQTIVVPEVFAASHTSDADAVLGIALSQHLAGTFEDMTMLLLEMFGDGE